MKKICFIVLCITLSTYSVFAQRIGAWDTHFSYASDVSQIVETGELVYALSDGKLFSYSPSDGHTQIQVKKDEGNINITRIAYNSKNKCLIIIRSNADIDLLYDNKDMVNVPDLKNSTQNIDKAINNIFIKGDDAYLSANFGILVLNLKKGEVKLSGVFNVPFYAMCIHENKIYAATAIGVMRIDENKNIQDFNNWAIFELSALYHFNDYQFNDKDIRAIAVFKDKLHFLVPSLAIYTLDSPTEVGRTLQGEQPLRMNSISNDQLIAHKANLFWDFKVLKEPETVSVANLKDVVADTKKANQYWIGAANYNLSQIKADFETHTYEFITSNIKPEGPLSNFPFFMTQEANKLLVTGGGYVGNRFDTPARLSELNGGKWFNFSKSEMDAQIGVNANARDFTAVISQPSDPSRLFVTSWGEGLYEFKDHAFVKVYNSTNTDGILEEIFPTNTGYLRLNGMAFDKNENLWLTNSMVNSPLKILQKNGVWKQLYYSQIADTQLRTNSRNFMIDRYNNKWISTTGGRPYLFVFDETGGDASTKYVDAFFDQDGKSIAINSFKSTVEDQTGNVWIGTNAGPFMVYNSKDIFKKSFVFNKIKIPRNDGTNNADILLEGVVINAIAVDGGNRKWIATETSGVYLVSANGQETIHNFTTDNSPLPSNNVLTLAIDPTTGIVYMGSDAGIVSFVSNATEGRDDFSKVSVFPNPVRPDYEGLITVTGLKVNSNVKITDIKGNLITQGQSLGGQFSWDGRNRNRQKVDTGVYLVFGASEDGSSGVVTKIMIVN